MKCVLSAAFGVVLLGAMKVNAQSPMAPTMTHTEFIQWMVQLSGDTGSIKAGATADDYVGWAKNQGIVPAGGWRPGAVLTRDVLAQALVQFFNLKAKVGSDAIRTLQREGIDIPGVTDSSEINRKDLVTMFDVNGFENRWQNGNHYAYGYWKNLSKHKTPTHHQEPPKPPTPKQKPATQVKQATPATSHRNVVVPTKDK